MTLRNSMTTYRSRRTWNEPFLLMTETGFGFLRQQVLKDEQQFSLLRRETLPETKSLDQTLFVKFVEYLFCLLVEYKCISDSDKKVVIYLFCHSSKLELQG
jgi:hypothetical protein